MRESVVGPLPDAVAHPWEVVEMWHGESQWKMWRFRWRWQARRAARRYWLNRATGPRTVTGYEVRRARLDTPR